MAVEIERKYLVIPEKLPELRDGVPIRQAYVPTVNGTTVRIRIAAGQAILAIKTRSTGISRREYEVPIPYADGIELLAYACQSVSVEKTRYYVEHAGLQWEVDVFEGENSGLIVAELELNSEDQVFPLPDWISQEVTLDSRYSNFNLANNPFSSWRQSA